MTEAKMTNFLPSDIDVENLSAIRKNIVDFMKIVSKTYATKPGKLLDIAPQNHEGARPFFQEYIAIETFDIDPDSGCTYIGDICKTNHFLSKNAYDYVVCTEVLEHTLQPFDAVSEIRRVLKTGGFLFASTPFNFRIHGPLPDCWRFTEHGLRVLLKDFQILELNELRTQNRPLMPIQYTIVAQKKVL